MSAGLFVLPLGILAAWAFITHLASLERYRRSFRSIDARIASVALVVALASMVAVNVLVLVR